MYLLLTMILMPMFQDDAKSKLWHDFVTANQVIEDSVPLFAMEYGFVKVMEYGKNKRKTLVRSDEMNSLMRGIGKSLSEEHASGDVKSSGILYLMFRMDEGQVVPLYFGKAEIFGKGDQNLSANISDLVSGNGKFGRWGYNYAYHIGDLSAVTLEGHPEAKKTKKYNDWKNSLFDIQADGIQLKGDVRFWACEWNPDRQSIWSDYGSTRLAFEEYLLIGVASDLFPNDLLNREGRNRR